MSNPDQSQDTQPDEETQAADAYAKRFTMTEEDEVVFGLPAENQPESE